MTTFPGKILVLFSVLTLVAACGGGGSSHASKSVAVPNVVGQTESAATAAIVGAGLQVGGSTSASSGTVPAGSVVSQNPAAGTMMSRGSPVSLVVSSGTPAQTVQSVSVVPASASIGKGATLQLNARAAYEDGHSEDVTSRAAWSSGAASVATVNASGLVTALELGAAAISARLGAVSGASALTVIANTAPVANVWRAQTVFVPAVVTLDGSASSDADGNLLTYSWTLVSKPANSAAALSSLNSAKTSFTVDVAGDYVASLIVNDGQAASAPATATVTGTTGIAGQGTWETTLKPRDIDGDGYVDAYYDITLNITWLADADAAAGTPYDTSTAADADGLISAADGLLYGQDARAWAASLSVHGVTGWRLPETDPIPPSPPQSSEMASMYYQTLGNSAAPSLTPRNTGPFANLRATEYWTGTFGVVVLECWTFDFSSGRQSFAQCVRHFGPGDQRAAWAVHDGDVPTAVPPP